MDSGVRDSKVRPIEDLEKDLLLVGGDAECKEEAKTKTIRKVRWNDTIGNELAQIMEFWPSDVSDSDDESNSCFCTIM